MMSFPLSLAVQHVGPLIAAVAVLCLIAWVPAKARGAAIPGALLVLLGTAGLLILQTGLVVLPDPQFAIVVLFVAQLSGLVLLFMAAALASHTVARHRASRSAPRG